MSSFCGSDNDENDYEVGMRETTAVAAAWVHDRAHQYVPSSGVHDALLQVAASLRRGDHIEAWKHGELDDLLKQFAPRLANPLHGEKK